MAVRVRPRPAAVEAAIPHLPVQRLSSEQYLEMIRAGILDEDDRVELLDGWMVPKMTKYQPHTITSGQVHEALIRAVPAGWYVGREEPLTATDLTTPEPDAMIVRGNRNDYPDRFPTSADVALVVEVADSSLGRDRREKLRAYAAGLIPVYWLFNVPERRVEVYTEPTGPAAEPTYQRREDLAETDELVLVLEGREIARFAVADLLPRRNA